jgi:hypothetical protein
MLDGSNDTVWFKEVPFVGCITNKFHLGVKKLPVLPQCIFSMQIKKIKQLFSGKKWMKKLSPLQTWDQGIDLRYQFCYSAPPAADFDGPPLHV